MAKLRPSELAVEEAMFDRLVRFAVITAEERNRVWAGLSDPEIRAGRMRVLFEHRADEPFPGDRGGRTYAAIWLRVYRCPLAQGPVAGVASAQT